MKKRRRLAVFLGALAVASSLTALPALATEGSFPSVQTEMPGEGTAVSYTHLTLPTKA